MKIAIASSLLILVKSYSLKINIRKVCNMYENTFKHAPNKLHQIIINKWPFFIPLDHESQLPVEVLIIKSLKLNILWIWLKVLANIIQGNFQTFWEMSYQLFYFQFFQIQLSSLFSILLVSPESVVVPVKQQVWIAGDLTLQKNLCIQDQLLRFGALQ